MQHTRLSTMHSNLCIPVVSNDAKDGASHFLIELQGTIEVIGDAPLSEATVDLTWAGPESPVLHIGQQVLYGNREALKRPLVLAKRTAASLEFIQSIKERLIFKQRPQQSA